MSKVLLSSGGMDSFLLAHEPELQGAKHVFVNIGQNYLAKERTAAKLVAQSCNAEFIEVVTNQIAKYEHESGIIPLRNAEMLLCAAQHGEQIYFGVIADEINSDKSVEFVAAIQDTMNISHRAQYWTEGKTYQILTPFREFTKSELVRRYLANGGSLEKLLTSVSCYDAGAHHCGRCASCFKRWVALVNATQVDNWQAWGFVEHPYTWKSAQEWAEKMKGYTMQRADELSGAFVTARRWSKP